jgi:hypothetical protein
MKKNDFEDFKDLLRDCAELDIPIMDTNIAEKVLKMLEDEEWDI